MSGFREDVLSFIKQIPEGRVMTYGGVARAVGYPQRARQVGMILFGIGELDGEIPWQRVINSQGGISTFKVGTGELQRALLKSEGVEVSADGIVDLKKYEWKTESG
jgi:methylated-DNA-protein-cysteine methyltransferase related protein